VTGVRVVDVTDDEGFVLIPPCADPSFDHRTCDYWEDGRVGSKAARASWLARAPEQPRPAPPADEPFNPFLAGASSLDRPAFNPFSAGTEDAENPFFAATDLFVPSGNPFAPPPPTRPSTSANVPRKLALLRRGLGLFGSYAKVILVDERPAAYAQFGPLSAYPRALSLRDLYPQLPTSPLPAVITCIATTAEARREGHARRLIAEVCRDLEGRGFAAVEAYPERKAALDQTSTGTIQLWLGSGFALVVDDPRFPVVRRELG